MLHNTKNGTRFLPPSRYIHVLQLFIAFCIVYIYPNSILCVLKRKSWMCVICNWKCCVCVCVNGLFANWIWGNVQLCGFCQCNDWLVVLQYLSSGIYLSVCWFLSTDGDMSWMWEWEWKIIKNVTELNKYLVTSRVEQAWKKLI